MFSAAVIMTMAIALGALLCVATLAYVMLIKPLPYPEQDQLYAVDQQLINSENKTDSNAFIYPNLMHLYQNQQVFEHSALMYLDGSVVTSLPSEPMMEIKYVSPQWFKLLNINTIIGRPFNDNEALNTYNPVAVLSYHTWQTEFSSDPNILNKNITLDGKSFSIIGVIDPAFKELPIAGAGYNTQLYLPWDFNSVSEHDRKQWGNDDGGLMFIGKTASGSTLSVEQMSQQLTQLIDQQWQIQVSDQHFFKDWRIQINTSPLKTKIISGSTKTVYLLLIGAIGLTLISIANIANLLLSRNAERQQQLAITAAVGATSRHIFYTLLCEIGLLMIAAMVFAQFIAVLGFDLLHYYLNDHLPRLNELSLNGVSVLVSFGSLIILTLALSYVAKRSVNYRALNASLQASGKGNAVQVSKNTRSAFIISQVAIATTLIFINVLLFKDALTLIEQPLGYQPDHTYAIVLSVPEMKKEARLSQLNALKTALSNTAKIDIVSQSMRPSIFGTYALTTAHDNKGYSISGKDIDEHYFKLINQRLLAGDNFTQQQVDNREPLIIVNDIFAKRLAQHGDVIGTTFNNGARIIGIVESITIPGTSVKHPRFYYSASRTRNMLLVKVKPNQSLTREEVIKIIKSVDKRLSLFSFSSLTHNKEQRLFSATTTATVTTALTIITLILSAIGLFGVLKYSTRMRRFEIGTRMAIGANGRTILSMIIKENLLALLAGLIASVAILLIIYFSIKQPLTQLNVIELITIYLSTSVTVIVVCFFACYLPVQHFIKQPVINNLKTSE